jgi:putative glutathione S-transferase
MGQLIDGVWTQIDIRDGEKNDKGEFIRKPVTFRSHISPESSHPPESHRYHLYVSYACPWAHRALITRKLKGLEEHISFSVVSPYMENDGWTFLHDFDSTPDDPIFHSQFLREIYLLADPKFTGRVTVPVLWDKKANTIVNNESSEILRIFNSEFDSLATNKINLYPQPLRSEIDRWNERIYNSINNGVYRCGFAKTQEAYNRAFEELFTSLEEVDKHLQKHPFLVSNQLTEADVRLFPTLVRFDPVYHTHFKCNGRLIAQYKGLSSFLKRFLEIPGVNETLNMSHIKAHYYHSHKAINPTGIVAGGPL